MLARPCFCMLSFVVWQMGQTTENAFVGAAAGGGGGGTAAGAGAAALVLTHRGAHNLRSVLRQLAPHLPHSPSAPSLSLQVAHALAPSFCERMLRMPESKDHRESTASAAQGRAAHIQTGCTLWASMAD